MAKKKAANPSMFARLANWIKQWKCKKQYWRHYNSAQGTDFDKTCAAVLMTELDEGTVRATALNHPPEQRKKFLMAYECFVMWLIKSNIERNQSQEFVKQLVVVLMDNIRRLGQYEEGVFEEIWTALQDAMPNSLTPPGAQTGIPAPWVHVVTACNAHGIELPHVTDLMFMTHIMMMFKHMHEFVEMTLIVQAK